MKSPTTNSRLYRRHSTSTPFLVLAGGLLFTFVVSYHLFSVAEAEDSARFTALAQEVHYSIESRLETYTALIRAGTGLFAASEAVNQDEFRSFIQRLDLSVHYPSVRAIGFSIKVNPEDVAALVDSRRRAGMTDFRVWPESRSAEYHSVVFLEPVNEANKSAIGYDMFTEPLRRAAMERARDTGSPAASDLVTLIQERNEPTKPPGFLIFAPVYRNGAAISNEVERQKALGGFIYGQFNADDFFRGIVGNEVYESLEFHVYDGSGISDEHLLHRSRSGGSTPGNDEPRFTAATNPEVVGNNSWTVVYFSRPGLDSNSGRNWVPYTFAGGVLLSFLFFGVSRSQLKARASAEQAESTVRKTLAERERAEDALREGEERYRELVENANDIVYSLDLEGNITSVNRAAESITGYSRDEMVSLKLSDIMSPESIEASRQMLSRTLAGEQRTNYELDIRAKDGRILTLEISSGLVRKNGQAVGVQGVARDITVRRRAEEALREADQRALAEYERLLERISALAQALGTARELLTIFRALREFTIVSVPCDGLFVSLYDPIRDVRTACYAWGDGQEVDTSALPPMAVTATGLNSRAVRTGQIIITDDYLSATMGNRSVVVGPDNGMRPQSSLALPMAVMGRIVGTIEVQSYERAAYAEEHATAMRMAANLTAVAIENVRLLERESSARAHAEESNRLKDEFLATVSHELRTPLTAILGWSRMLEASSINDPMAERALETIRRNAKAQSQIIDDILDVSRIITGKLYLDLHPIELVPVIEGAINVVRPTAEAKGIQIDCRLESKPIVVTGDSNRLQQVVWNLLSNAIKFTPRGGHVVLSLDEIGNQVEFRVTDSGQGISSEFLPYVFDRFRQADSTSTRQHGGLGLGLAIARHLVEIHGGTIKAESPGEGKGSTFSVRLPLVGTITTAAPQIRGEKESGIKSQSRLNGIHVLLVDDDADTLDLLSTALKQQKAKVTAVSSAADAISAIKTSRPDIVVSDIAMPGEDGYQLIEKIRAMNFDSEGAIPAVAITAYAKEEDRETALSSGYQNYLAKPIELSELVTIVAQTVRRG